MSTPRVEINLNKIQKNSQYLVQKLRIKGINTIGVTKAVCGDPAIALAIIAGGVTGLADSRIENVIRMREAGIISDITMIRTPMSSQIQLIVDSCNFSYNTEISVIEALACTALKKGKIHNIVLMVEMGDLREGIMPSDLENTFNTQVTDFCYPFGRFNNLISDLVKESGYLSATTMERGIVKSMTNRFMLPRMPINHRTLPHLFLAKILTNYEDRR